MSLVKTNNKYDKYEQSIGPFNWISDPNLYPTQYNMGENSSVSVHNPLELVDESNKISYRENKSTRENKDYNMNKQAVAPYKWIIDNTQNSEQYNLTETGINSSIGLHTPSDIINVSSYLSDRGNILTKELPPEVKEQIKSYSLNNIETLKQEKLKLGNIDSSQYLSPVSTRGKGKEKDLSDVDWKAGFSGVPTNLPIDHQDQTHIVNRNILERNGLDSSQIIKSTWNNATVSNPSGPVDENNNVQKATNLKIAGIQSYPIWAPFGMRQQKTWEHFTPVDVVSSGRSSSAYDNKTTNFNMDAEYLNGGCNKTSKLDKSNC